MKLQLVFLDRLPACTGWIETRWKEIDNTKKAPMADKTTPEFCGLINARICSMILNCKKKETYLGKQNKSFANLKKHLKFYTLEKVLDCRSLDTK
jgi:hypothetical protein